MLCLTSCFFFFSSRRRHTRLQGDWSSDVCSSDLWPWLRRPCAAARLPRFQRPWPWLRLPWRLHPFQGDRKSTRLNSSHLVISYAVFCLKKKKKKLSTDAVESTYACVAFCLALA